MYRRVRNVVLALAIAGFLVAAACSMTSTDVSAQNLVLSRGCYSSYDNSTADLKVGFKTWYSYLGGSGDYGLDSPYGAFRYCSVVSFPDNAGPVTVTRYLTGNVVCIDYFAPGGGFADYIMCDSIRIVKAATDTVSFKLCW